MKWLSVLTLCLVLILGLGGQLSAQTHLTVTGTLYEEGTPQVTAIDQDHWVGFIDYRGIRIDTTTPQVAALNNMAADGKFVMFGDKNAVHIRGYLTFMDKDGDKMVWEFWDVPGNGKADGKIVASTGKFAGIEGTTATEGFGLTDFKDGPIYFVGHCVEKLTLKAPF
jgi:hypothetical protein